jgi:hypothetical protein
LIDTFEIVRTTRSSSFTSSRTPRTATRSASLCRVKPSKSARITSTFAKVSWISDPNWRVVSSPSVTSSRMNSASVPRRISTARASPSPAETKLSSVMHRTLSSGSAPPM